MDYRVFQTNQISDRDTFVSLVKSRIGAPYLWGGQGDNYFDCSGLIMWGLWKAGIHLKDMTSRAMASRWENLQSTVPHKGCLCFYGRESVSHVMMVADVWDKLGEMFTLVGARGGTSNTRSLEHAYQNNAMVSCVKGNYWSSRHKFMVDIFNKSGSYIGGIDNEAF